MGKKLTQKEFDMRVQHMTGNSYVFLEPFNGVHQKIIYYHVDCGHFNYVEPNSFFHGHRCPYCFGNNKKTDKEFRKEVFDLCGYHYKFLDKYKSAREKIECEHIDCGFRWKIAPNTFLSLGARCPVCNGGVVYSTDYIQDIIDQVNGKNIFLITKDFKNKQGRRILKIRHNEFNHEITYMYNYLQTHFYKIVCPYCYPRSMGEQLVSSVLSSLGIKYISQYKFSDLADIYKLSYDFYVPKFKLLIEYQGEQHYYPVKFFGGISNYNKQLKHDCMKKAYAKYHGFNLLEIPFYCDNFNDVKNTIVKYICNTGYSIE